MAPTASGRWVAGLRWKMIENNRLEVDDSVEHVEEEYDFTSDENLGDPYPMYARMRIADPAWWSPRLQSWLISRYPDCVHVLRNRFQFGADRRRLGERPPDEVLFVQNLDGLAHAALRKLLIESQRAQDLAEVAARARRRADQLLDELVGRDQVDLLNEYAVPLGLDAICDFMGVDPPEVSSFTAIAEIITRSFDSGFWPELVEPGELARAEMTALIESWGVRHKGRGMVSHLLERRPAEVSTKMIFNSLRVVFFGGFVAIANAFANALKAVFTRGVPLAIFGEPSRAGRALEEIYRYDGPVHANLRYAMEDVQIAGRQIRRGESVIALVAAANRDPQQFDRAEELVLDRLPNPHLAFGWGIHACTGAHLSSLVTRLALASLCERAPGIELAEPLQPKRQISHRAPQRVSVRWI